MEAVLPSERLETPDKPLLAKIIELSYVYARHFLGKRTRKHDWIVFWVFWHKLIRTTTGCLPGFLVFLLRLHDYEVSQAVDRVFRRTLLAISPRPLPQ